MSVRTYQCDCINGCMAEVEEGSYVLKEDYDEVVRQLTELRNQLQPKRVFDSVKEHLDHHDKASY